MRITGCLVSVLVVPVVALAQGTSVPSDTLLAGITARGRLLAAYDQAAWHATDAWMALHPDLSVANTMIARERPDGGWTVLFAQLNDHRDTLFLAYEAVQTARPDSFVVRRHSPTTPLVGPELQAALALHTAQVDFGTPTRTYNSYVLPRIDGAFWVYFLPAQTDAREFPHGADVRYVIAADGRRILQKRPMHRALLNLALPDSAQGGVHTVLLDDVPQDSDIFLVLARIPRRPELIATAHYVYQIAVDGTITWSSR
jgi:hypothetical protein